MKVFGVKARRMNICCSSQKFRSRWLARARWGRGRDFSANNRSEKGVTEKSLQQI